MAAVYAGSIYTLSALSSRNSNGGFFRNTKKEATGVFRYDFTLGSQRIRVFHCGPNIWSLDGPLMERAWTLQEQQLYNRNIYFS